VARGWGGRRMRVSATANGDGAPGYRGRENARVSATARTIVRVTFVPHARRGWGARCRMMRPLPTPGGDGAPRGYRRGRQVRVNARAARPRCGSSGPGYGDPLTPSPKGRHNDSGAAVASAHSNCAALSGLGFMVATSTQGGAALCPGLICSGPFRARTERAPD